MTGSSLAGNPCLAAGHELVQRFEYEDGVYDGLAREFLGFAKTRAFDGPSEIGSLREIDFHQSPALKGRIAAESVYAGGVDLLSRTLYDWRTRADGPRTQVYLQEQRVEEFALYPQFGAGASQCVVHRNSIFLSNGAADPQDANPVHLLDGVRRRRRVGALCARRRSRARSRSIRPGPSRSRAR